MNSNRRPDIRAGTRAGTPDALSPRTPSRLSFGSIEADAPGLDSPSVAYAARPSAGAGSASVRAATSVVRTGAYGAEKPALVAKIPSQDGIFAAAQREPEGRKTVTHLSRQSRLGVANLNRVESSRFIDSIQLESTSSRYSLVVRKYVNDFASEPSDFGFTIPRATADLSDEEFISLVRRHEAYTAELRAKMEHQGASDRKRAIEGAQGGEDTDSSHLAEHVKTGGTQHTPAKYTGHAPALPSHRTTVEEVEGEDYFESSTSAVQLGNRSFRNKGKGDDPGNWGDVSFLEKLAENNLKAGQDAIENIEQMHRVEKHERVTTPREVLVDVSLPHRSKPEADKAKSPFKALKADGKTPSSDNEASKPKPTAAATNRENMSGQTNLSLEEMLAQLLQRISELEARQRAGIDPPKVENPQDLSKSSMTPKLRGVTPGRLAARSFLDKALRGGNKTGQGPPPSDSSDSSSSSSSDSSSPSSDKYRGSRRRPSSPRMSAKRKRGKDRKRKMLLKPISPRRYDEQPDANLIHHFVREASTVTVQCPSGYFHRHPDSLDAETMVDREQHFEFGAAMYRGHGCIIAGRWTALAYSGYSSLNSSQ
ncbi:hypothetical protein DFH08DRAFT_1043938 [Mycena albidolilacea]|uniref:Uncharacterized protein n=1 Tax=Mycena albidolilacea TaxID=1033008 RepID=A0AAD6Z9X4_9AGAR|nr:hypothetical protein DFH08DRAFT_1043938 [Mycena albidolilacea]